MPEVIPPPQSMSSWQAFIAGIKDLGEVVKFLALVLAAFGLLGLYFPGLRSAVQVRFNPSAWYYIGAVTQGQFDAEAFQHPLWSGGSSPASALTQLPSTTMITIGALPHVGRISAGPAKAISANASTGLCLYVKQVQVLHKSGDPRGFVWARAVKISC